jgi:hypothetical protein
MGMVAAQEAEMRRIKLRDQWKLLKKKKNPKNQT